MNACRHTSDFRHERARHSVLMVELNARLSRMVATC
jgi:hypothetical protein